MTEENKEVTQSLTSSKLDHNVPGEKRPQYKLVPTRKSCSLLVAVPAQSHTLNSTMNDLLARGEVNA